MKNSVWYSLFELFESNNRTSPTKMVYSLQPYTYCFTSMLSGVDFRWAVADRSIADHNTKPDIFKSIHRRAIESKSIMDICKEQPHIEEWHLIGLLSSFPDISQDNERCHVLPACKTLSVPNAKSAQSRNRLSDLNDQVLVFKYKGFLHAIDNACCVPLSLGCKLTVASNVRTRRSL